MKFFNYLTVLAPLLVLSSASKTGADLQERTTSTTTSETSVLPLACQVVNALAGSVSLEFAFFYEKVIKQHDQGNFLSYIQQLLEEEAVSELNNVADCEQNILPVADLLILTSIIT